MTGKITSGAQTWARHLGVLRIWACSTIICAIAAWAFLYWLYQAQSEQLNEAVSMLESVRAARIDLAQSTLRLNTLGTNASPNRDAILTPVQEAIAEVSAVLDNTSLPPAYQQDQPLTQARLSRLGNTYIDHIRAYLADRSQPLAVAMGRAHDNLENFAVQVDDAGHQSLTRLQSRTQSHFNIALTGSGIMLSFLCFGVWMSYRRDVDVSRRIRTTSEALESHEALLRDLGDSLPNSYVYQTLVGPDGMPQIEYMSAGAEAIHGHSVEAMLADASLLYGQIVPEQYGQLQAKERACRQAMTDFSMDLNIVLPSGEEKWLHVRSRPRNRADGRVVWNGVATDVSAQKKANETLLSHKLMLDQTGRIAKVGGWTLDVTTGEGAWTDELARIHDLDPNDAINMEKGLSFYTPESRPIIEDAVGRAISHGESYDLELELVSARGVRKWVHTIGYAVKENGKVVRLHGSLQDITEGKSIEAQFQRAQRLEAIGTLASGVAHDLNNILSPVMMITGLLQTRLDKKEDIQALQMLETSVQRGANIIRQLLAFSRGADDEKVSMQPQLLVKEMLALLRETFPRNIMIEERLSADLWPVVGDPTKLHQVLMNLCVNARDAMGDGGTLIVGAQNRTITPDQAQSMPESSAGPYLQLTIIDNGDGMSPEIVNRIFDPFFTTKEQGKGTGLGLSTVAGIIKNHGGFLQVLSREGHGTTFEIYLPAAGETSQVTQVPTDRTQKQGNGETILVVDDEESIRDATRRILKSQNFRVLSAENGERALAQFMENQDQVKLVLTDLMMPEMNGIEFVRLLRVVQPTLPIIAASGLIQRQQQDELATMGITDILTKPYARAELLAAIQRQLAPDDG